MTALGSSQQNISIYQPHFSSEMHVFIQNARLLADSPAVINKMAAMKTPANARHPRVTRELSLQNIWTSFLPD